jgi:hypothetical protein
LKGTRDKSSSQLDGIETAEIVFPLPKDAATMLTPKVLEIFPMDIWILKPLESPLPIGINTYD